ncbi:MAG: vitamin K epoxide reductase family protein [Chthoniobacter sp.]|uniref:vitamin K epoxide reductase family protein n=1 Tax=Chthoniobacter sp. TaxID=2510640 RepID=UPI0032A7FF52
MGFPEPSRPPNADLHAPTGRGSAPVPVWLGSVLAWLGVCLCFVLLQRETGLRSFLCPARGACEAVLSSQYAQLRGIPLAWLGALFYLGLLALWLAVLAVSSSRMRLRLLDAILWLVVIGLTFSVGLMYLQVAVIHAFCPLCTLSATTVAALLAVGMRARRAVASGPAGASPMAAWTIAIFATFPVLILATESVGERNTTSRLWAVDLSTAHRLGPVVAPVQLVVFSDFQCGFCRQLAPVLKQLHGEFPQDVSIVFRHFPLEGHPRAFPSAIAAECAAEQGHFWEYHDKLFAEGGNLSDAKLLDLALSLGLDQPRFTACLQSDRPRKVVEANRRDAQQLDLPGAPAVFLNGRRLEGPLTYENLARRIKEALPAPPRDTPARN